MHAKYIPPTEVSCDYLCSYLNSLLQLGCMGVEEVIKGKAPMLMEPVIEKTRSSSSCLPWPAPPPGWVALSVDGSYCAEDGAAGSGMVLRDDKGGVIFAAYRRIYHCNEVLEAELHAIMEGVSLAIQQSNRPVQLQSDCLAALSALSNDSLDRSAYGHLLAEIKGLLENRVFVRVKVSRDQNKVAHCLANYGRSGDSTVCWLNQSPPFISELVAKDCNSVSLE